MFKRLFWIVSCFILVGAIRAGEVPPSLTRLSWLAGSWQLAKDNRVVTEVWMAPEGKTMLGMSRTVVAGATLTATSVGITARVLSDLNRLQEPESQIILGAAVIDDVIGLVILAVVGGLAQGEAVTALGVLQTAGLAFGFLAGTILVGRLIVPPLVRLLGRIDLPGTPTGEILATQPFALEARFESDALARLFRHDAFTGGERFTPLRLFGV